MSGGAIYISGESSLYIEKSTFKKNYAKRSGGAIAGDFFQILEISKNSHFEENFASLAIGDAIYANNPFKYVNITDDSNFVSFNSSNFLNFQYVPNIKIIGITFEQKNLFYDDTNLRATAVYIFDSY